MLSVCADVPLRNYSLTHSLTVNSQSSLLKSHTIPRFIRENQLSCVDFFTAYSAGLQTSFYRAMH